MKIDSDTLHKIAHLARLEIRPHEEADMVSNLEKVLTWMEQLNEVDTTHVAPLIHMSEALNVLRPDEARATMTHDEALANAPKHDGTYFAVPKVIE
jgi:aspartyl-tRNA(Asn)/glutamyl-tRNA(Gln) amidotransferase subunit C